MLNALLFALSRISLVWMHWLLPFSVAAVLASLTIGPAIAP